MYTSHKEDIRVRGDQGRLFSYDDVGGSVGANVSAKRPADFGRRRNRLPGRNIRRKGRMHPPERPHRIESSHNTSLETRKRERRACTLHFGRKGFRVNRHEGTVPRAEGVMPKAWSPFRGGVEGRGIKTLALLAQNIRPHDDVSRFTITLPRLSKGSHKWRHQPCFWDS